MLLICIDVVYGYCLNVNIDIIVISYYNCRVLNTSSMVDKDLMKSVCNSVQYIEGVRSFIEFVHKNGGGRTMFSCPCNSCKNGKGPMSLSKIDYHFLKNGIQLTYTTWRFHGEKSHDKPRSDNVGVAVDNRGIGVDNLGNSADNGDDFSENINPACSVDENVGVHSRVHNDDGTSSSKKKIDFYERAREPLYPSCHKENTPLYAAIKLNNINTQYGFYNNGVTALLKLFKELLPDGNTLPYKFHDVKKLIQELGMDYLTYDACVNDCSLYWKDHASLVKCLMCQEPRYDKVFNDERNLTQVSRKTLIKTFSIDKLQRFYSIPWIEEAMYWNSIAQSDGNVMRHPVDSSA
ncbi:uncharacterized protein LOC113351720 [Papaver somniferum]|uniref:uncharacterized protein LOC113351720 n=1 Tax=Papaver somniferum TaxID=3469 RepID=UPI000E703B9F|nr:uncharacterized protein LOC113351720 [Papaver somniferum]